LVNVLGRRLSIRNCSLCSPLPFMFASFLPQPRFFLLKFCLLPPSGPPPPSVNPLPIGSHSPLFSSPLFSPSLPTFLFDPLDPRWFVMCCAPSCATGRILCVLPFFFGTLPSVPHVLYFLPGVFGWFVYLVLAPVWLASWFFFRNFLPFPARSTGSTLSFHQFSEDCLHLFPFDS